VPYNCTYTFNQEHLDSLSKEELTALKRRLPSLFWTPNRAQERPCARWYEPPYPRTHIVTFGNRTGKTEWLGEVLCGAAKGNKYVNPNYCASPFFDALDEKRKNGTLTIWWICEAELMKKNAADYKIISKHIPDARFKSRTNNGVYREIHIPVMGEGNKPRMQVVQVKTHDQETISFAGDFVDVIICDEPPPEKHWTEICARTVTPTGEEGGRIIIGGTPLNIGAFLLDIIEEATEDDEKGRVVHDEGSIWENCDGAELPPEIAEKYNIPKNPDTGIYETRGHLSLEGIENAIKNWEKSNDPDAMSARVDGKFTHVQGRIYKIFHRPVHTINPYPIPKTYPIIQICDPHNTRPDAVGWFMGTPGEKLICIAEHPILPYENLVSRSETIGQSCEAWRKIESELGIAEQIAGRFGDPIFMNNPDPNTHKTKQQLYAMHGFNFNVNITSRLEYIHEKVREFLWYDKERWEKNKEEPIYQPQLLFFNTCRNHITFMIKYSTKQNKDISKPISEQMDKKWSDYAMVVGYAVVAFRGFKVVNAEMRNKNSEWEAIKRSRNPYGRTHLLSRVA